VSDIFSKIWLEHTLEPAMPRFRLTARARLNATAFEKARVAEWLDDVSLKLVEHGPYVRAEVI
jgi:hypothetical protein